MNYSKQRDAIIKYLKEVKTHPTAEEVYNDLRVQNPVISLGTVYRNLDKLAKSGEILRLKEFGNKDRFDGNNKHHYHAECVKCKKVFDVYQDYFKSIDKQVQEKLGYDVLSHEVKFNVICPMCKEKIKEEWKWI